MIDPKELRIGNLVTDAFQDCIIEVDSISKDGINIRSSVLSGITYTPLSQIFGIPVKEIVKRFDLLSAQEKIDILGRCKYVHELQNAFYNFGGNDLTKEEWISLL